MFAMASSVHGSGRSALVPRSVVDVETFVMLAYTSTRLPGCR